MGDAAFTLEPVDAVAVTVLMDNVSDALALDNGPAKRSHLVGSGSRTATHVAAPTLDAGETLDSLIAEHGFSVLVSFEKAGRTHRVLFDTGLSPDGVVENMRRLDLTPKDVEVIVLSHGHFDHTTGMSGIVRALGRTNLPVFIHPEFWTKRRIAIPGRDPWELPSTSRSALEGAGFDITEERRPSFLFERSLLITGEVDRTTDFEQGFAVHQALRGEEWQPDPLILDDQALIAHVRGQGLVVITGCGHAGVVNIARYARKLTGVDDIYALIGGFHLSGPLFAGIIPATCDALTEIAPRHIVPSHCTGPAAQRALANAFGEVYLPNNVGTRYEL
jgi:7,8-dihydropterin-6-yl-methyl-4-(beta-D-ribofuranosyl)aminobenzene 5'-phosphate synthase